MMSKTGSSAGGLSLKGLSQTQLGQVLFRFRKEFVWVGFFSMVANVLMISPTLYMLQVYDRVMISQNEVTLIALTLIVVVFFSAMSFAEWLRARLLVRLSLRLDDALNTQVFKSGFASFLKSRQLNPTEALNDLVTLRQFLTGNGIIAFFDVPWIPVYIGIAFLLHRDLGIAAVVFACIQIALAIWVHRRSTGQFSKLSQISLLSSRFLQAKLKSAELIEVLGMRLSLRSRWLDRYLKYLEENERVQDASHTQQLLTKLLQFSQQSLILGLGALLVINGEISPGTMVAANLLLGKALQPLQMLVSSWRGFVQAKESYERLNTLFETFDRADYEQGYRPQSGHVRVATVEATAPGRAKPILQSLSLDIPAGQVLMVVGPSGAGKSTLAKLLMGVWFDHTGQVTVDGQLVAVCDRSLFGYLPQEIELLDGTISENIARFQDVDPDLVVAAARLTGIHDLILRLPKGYDTHVGEAGHLLSGGQRQRLALARAFYGSPVLVVLDEPNAHLDDVGEKALLQAIQSVKGHNCTVVVISHRPSVLQVADRMLVLQAGAIVQDSPAQQVLAALKNKAQPGPGTLAHS